MTYDEALEYMASLNKRGIHPGLEGIKLLCDSLSNPEDGQKYIHVVGTNGKGSTAEFISEILRASGLKVGIYQSPAVFSTREIIRVNGREISKADYAELTYIISQKNTFGCTRFEVETVLAFMYFKRKDCDTVILEAGMGGELDATNIIKDSLESVFTAIGLDHCQFLGDTLTQIAETKTGVIKPDSIAVSTFQADEVIKVIERKAKERKALFAASDLSLIKNIKYKSSGTFFDYKDLKNLEISMYGTFQVQNACLAIDAVRALEDKGIKVTEADIRKGLKKTVKPGRFEKISDKPQFFLDGAHNPPAAARFRETVETYFTKKKIIYIMGMLKDKDVEKVVSLTADLASSIFTVATPKTERTMSSFELGETVRKYNRMVSSMDSIDEAVEMAMMMADKDTVIIAFGSLSHLSKVKKAVENRNEFKRDNHGVKR